MNSVSPIAVIASIIFAALPGRSANGITIRPLVDREWEAALPAASKVGGFDLTKIDDGLCDEFAKAWRVSSNGSTGEEGLVLVFRMVGGRYAGRSLGATSERLKFTFKWVPNAIAIVHTHPNHRPPQPSEGDELIAIKYGVPIFTITATGMFVFDPETRQTRKVMEGLDWLDPSNFTGLSLLRFVTDAHPSATLQ